MAKKLFISYSHKDESLREDFGEHLSMMQRNGIVECWHDRKIIPADDWRDSIDKNLESADIIIFLVSSSFLASNYCYDVEVKRAMERHVEGAAQIISIILRDCDWDGCAFSRFQVVPKNALPITKWEDKDTAWLDAIKGIKRHIEEFEAKASTIGHKGIKKDSHSIPEQTQYGLDDRGFSMDISSLSQLSHIGMETLGDGLEDRPKGMARLLLAYGPPLIRNFISNGRTNLKKLQVGEELFDATLSSLLDAHRSAIDAHNAHPGDPINRFRVQLLEKEIRVLATIKNGFQYLDYFLNGRNSETPESINSNENLWWNIFEDLASKRNEEWRIDLFSRALALQTINPQSFSLKALFEIGLLEERDFIALTVFCESCVYVDGKPMMLMEPQEQVGFEVTHKENRSGNLALCISSLIDRGLVQKAETQFDTSDLVILQCQSGNIHLRHEVENQSDLRSTAIRIEAYSPTDYTFDICQLLFPIFNEASDRNVELLQTYLEACEAESEDGVDGNKFIFIRVS